MSSVYSAGASRGSGGVFLTSLGLIAFGLAIKSDFSQFQSFFSKDSIEEKRQEDKEIISLLPKVVPLPVQIRPLVANFPLPRNSHR